MIVAEEQARETNGQISDEALIPASSAAMEAIVNQTLKKEEKKVHPMFRRTSTSNSTSTEGMDNDNDTKPRKRRRVDAKETKGKGPNRNGKVKEEPIELVDSDDDLDEKPKRNGRSRGGAEASESPLSDEDDPQALFKVDQSRCVSSPIPLQASLTSITVSVRWATFCRPRCCRPIPNHRKRKVNNLYAHPFLPYSCGLS